METSDDEAEDDGRDVSSSTLAYPVVALCVFFLSWQVTYKVPNTCISALLAFFCHFLIFVAGIVFSEKLSVIARSLPSSITQLRKIAGDDVDSFTKLVVCPQCHSIYDFDTCLFVVGSRKEIKLCQHIAYPDHPHSSFRKSCAQPLLRMCKRKATTIYRPFKVFCCQNIISSMKGLWCRPNFIADCQRWCNRNIPNDVLGDIYDGRVWKEFRVINEKPFLDDSHTFAFSLNVDWFQPYKHVTDSIGAVYLSILNLPRNLHYKPENIILCGILLGPKEPKDLNSYLYPLVHEMLLLWERIVIKTQEHSIFTIRAALLCISSDIPATRKLCGFASHVASFGCSKCLKKFPFVGDKLDYSGFERAECPVQNMESICSEYLQTS